jgi:hypothetical protein
VESIRNTSTCTIIHSLSESVLPAIRHVKQVVGAKELTIVKSFRKSTAVHNVMRVDVMVMSLVNVVTFHAPVDVPARRKATVW